MCICKCFDSIQYMVEAACASSCHECRHGIVGFGELRQTTRHSNGGNHSGCQQEVAEECARPRDHKGGTN